MPRGRPSKRRSYNFGESSTPLEGRQDAMSAAGANLPSTSSNNTYSVPLNEEDQHKATSTRLIRAAKVKCMNKITDALADEKIDEYAKRLRYKQQRERERLANQIEKERDQRLEKQNRRTSQRRENETGEDHDHRLEEDRRRKTQRRANETSEDHDRRLEEQSRRTSQRRADETSDAHDRRLEEQSRRTSLRREDESSEDHDRRLEEDRRRKIQRRADETSEDHDRRLEEQSRRTSQRREDETSEDHDRRLEEDRRRKIQRREDETSEDHDRRLEVQSRRTLQRREDETSEEHDRRLEEDRRRKIQRRTDETSEDHDRRLEEQSRRTLQRREDETSEDHDRRLEEDRRRKIQRREDETSEDHDRRLEEQSRRTLQRREDETSEDHDRRLEEDRRRKIQRREDETSEDHDRRLEEQSRRTSQRREDETSEDHDRRLEEDRRRKIQRRAAETSENHDRRLEEQSRRTSQRRADETSEDHDRRLEEDRRRKIQRRADETSEDHDRRLEEQSLRTLQRREDETSEDHDRRLEEDRRRKTQQREDETNKERNRRLEEQRRRYMRHQRIQNQNQLRTYKHAVIAVADVSYKSLEPFNVACIHCGAIHFSEERVANKTHPNSFGDCCLHGKIKEEPPIFPNELKHLFLRRHPHSEEFHKRIRNLNACFALASFNVNDDRTIHSHGIYSFTVGGQVYHKMNMAAHPTQTAQGEFERPQYGQMYFMDSDDAIAERLEHPLNHGISQTLMELLEQIIRLQNPFAQGFMMMREVEQEVNQRAAANGFAPPHVHLLFTIPESADYRRFNVPVSNEVCAVITLNADQSFPEHEMVVRQRGKSLVTLKNIDNRVEPFTYPLFYPKGTLGFSIDKKLHIPYASRQTLTRLELAQYRIAFRPELIKLLPPGTAAVDLREDQFNSLHFGGRLFQQYLVDTYIRVERDRIQWIKLNQKKILSDNYIGVNNFINILAQEKNAVVSEKVILPSTFPGSTRFYTEHFEDAMAIVRRLGAPDFFITVSCNPNWQELKAASCIAINDGTTLQQLTQDRPDLVARIAKLKFDSIIDQLDKRQIFGKVAAFVYTIEFQKRGLPHMHLLLIMNPEDKIHNSEELDDLISAEIPDHDDPELRRLVIKWMIHNPCGVLNQDAPCMINKNGSKKCRFNFPKSFQDLTSLVDDEKPKYRRRYDPKLDQHNTDEFSHQHAVYRKDKNNSRITRDNRHVASYNAYLLKRYDCHINVEYVGTIRAVKYLYKYIYKGHDCASIKIIEDERRLIYNEADTYVEGRCITPPEACWRLFGNEIQKKSHFVQRLDIHLANQYRIINIDQAPEDLADIGQKNSTIDAYFQHNQMLRQQEDNPLNVNSEIHYHYYWQMPEYFVWEGTTSKWVARKRRMRVIGRIHNVNFVAQPELYHLRLLLYHVKNATSFHDLLMVSGNRYATYKQACLARGLVFDDQQWIEGLQESAVSKMPRAMRTLFVQILIFGSPENPKRLWEMFKRDLADDFIQEARQTGKSDEEGVERAYRIIAYKLNTEATEGRNFRFWVEQYGMDNINSYGNQLNEQVVNIDNSISHGSRMYGMLKGKQIEIVDIILSAINNRNIGTKCFFIDGPGGTGKTFIYKTLYYMLQGRNWNVKCMAFTGIASILLPNGRTAHKTFGLKVPLTSDSISNIKPGSIKATELAKIDVFLMDEAPMLPKYGLQNMDELLRKIGNSNLPFGGKIMVLGGDFRQCLPVQPRANKSELLDLSIKQSELWKHFTSISLVDNMRVDIEQVEFANYLLKLGNGELSMNELDEIRLPDHILSNGNLIDEVFGNCLVNHKYEEMKNRTILAPLNKDVSKINAEIIEQLSGDYKVYISYDSVKDQPEGALQFTSEFLNSIEIADLPPHELKLKKNTIVMLLRNLDVSEGLCNGTRLIVTDLCNNIIKANIITGEQSGRQVHIPRITLDSSKCQLGCTMQRHQFPVRPAFAMTVHKAQGQTFDFVAIDLRVPVFMHGMLYVAFSRVKSRANLKVLLPQHNPQHTRNIVWKQILQRNEAAIRL